MQKIGFISFRNRVERSRLGPASASQLTVCFAGAKRLFSTDLRDLPEIANLARNFASPLKIGSCFFSSGRGSTCKGQTSLVCESGAWPRFHSKNFMSSPLVPYGPHGEDLNSERSHSGTFASVLNKIFARARFIQQFD